MADTGSEPPLARFADALAELGAVPDLSDLVDQDPAVTSDPGTEVVDLPDRLALFVEPEDVPTWGALKGDRGFSFTRGLDALAARVSTAVASDYVWLTWLPEQLRAVGLSVVEHPGWRTRGRPRSVGPFTPAGVLWHHDASPRGPSPYVGRFLAEVGRPDEGIPAPLSQTWVCAGCEGAHPVGTWHVLAAGRANHGGEGVGFGAIGPDLANSLTVGVETDNTVNEPTPGAMFASLVVGTAAIQRRLRTDPRRWVAGHKEYARGRKIDPDDVDMDRGRRLVVRVMRHQADGLHGHKGNGRPPRDGGPRRPEPEPFPGREHFQIGYRCSHGYVTKLGRWLVAAGYDRYGDADGYTPGPLYTEYDRRNLAAFQRRSERGGVRRETGDVGPHTWRWLQVAAAASGARTTGRDP